MTILIVGADDLGSIKHKLKESGATDICHITGRNCGDRRTCPMAQSIELVLILTDYVNHGAALKFKRMAKSRGIPLICAKRSWCAIQKRMSDLGIQLSALKESV